MGTFGEALKKAGITGGDSREYDRNKITAFTLEMKLYEMKDHIDSMKRIYRKYLNAEGTDRLDYRDSLANRFGYMVIAFQDIMESVMEAEGEIMKNEDISIRRAIGRFQSLFPEECEKEEVDNAVTSMSDRNEIVHAYENYNIFSFFCYTKYEVLILGFIYYFLFDIIERIIKEENHELR